MATTTDLEQTGRDANILHNYLDGEPPLRPASEYGRLGQLILRLIEELGSGTLLQYDGRVDSVEDLPETGQLNHFYLVGPEDASEFDEYFWVQPEGETGHWDRLGSVAIIIDDHLDTQSTNPVQNSVITLAINGLTVCLATAYDTTASYVVGSYCTHGQTLYKSNAVQNPAGEWDSSKWDAVTVMGEITSALAGLATVARTGDYNDLTNKPTIPTVADRFKSAAAAEEYDATHVYTEGEFMTLDGELYKCSSSGAYLVVKELFSYYGASLKTAEHAYLDNSALANYGGPYLVQGQDNGYYTVILPITSGRIYDFYIPSTEYVPSTNDPACCAFSNSSSAYTSLTDNPLSSNARYKLCPKTISFTAPSPGFAVTIRKTYESSYTLKEKTAYKFVKTTIAAELAGKANTFTIDSTPTDGSTNPVQSGGVHTALGGKQDVLTFDSIPTASSNNPVTSDGIKKALDGKVTEGSGYAVINGIRVYVSSTTPTGDIPEGSLGIGF